MKLYKKIVGDASVDNAIDKLNAWAKNHYKRYAYKVVSYLPSNRDNLETIIIAYWKLNN